MKKQALIILVLIVAGLIVLSGCQPESGSVSTPASSPADVSKTGSKANFVPDEIVNSPAPGQNQSPTPEATLADLPMGRPSPNMGEWEVRRYKARFSACQSNLKVIAVALEMYMMDNGSLPPKLSDLTPLYMKTLLSCPDAGTDTYSDSYSISQKTGDYMIYCKGHNHKMLGVPSDYPRYTGKKGLILPEGYREAATPMEALTTCKTNLKNIATALEMYATDNSGRYPKDLKQICPSYLRQMPTCPASGADSYSSAYTCRESPDSYTFYCRGHNHAQMGIPEDYPLYDAQRGLIEKPQ